VSLAGGAGRVSERGVRCCWSRAHSEARPWCWLCREPVASSRIEAFALDHRCIFAYEHGKPSFEKDDIVW